MTSPSQYPFVSHPCYSETRDNLWARIHLPVARTCNVKCIFCDHSVGSSCHTSKPGYSASIMDPKEAIARTFFEIEKNPRLKIVAISGPGEPLANEETFTTLQGIRNQNEDLNFCLCTNGVLLADAAPKLKELGVKSITVTINAIFPETAAQVYEWARIDGEIMHGLTMGESIIRKQLEGIERTVALGITVKVNTILMPNINTGDIENLSRRIADYGASLHNIVPLILIVNNPKLISPTKEELFMARQIASENIAQFTHCKQCRSDVVGIPGADRVL